MYGDVHYQERMFEAGALAYVLKNEAIDDLVSAIAAALRGERFVSPATGRLPEATTLRSVELDKDTLSEREVEVLRLLAEGRRMKEIAVALGISVRTVETYRNRIMLKLGIDNLPGLVKFAVRAGITTPGP
jgi:DNA-binding NarL/FixJ family response regulator